MFRRSGKKTLTGEKKPTPLESMAFLYLGKMFENINLSVNDIIKIINEGNTGNKKTTVMINLIRLHHIIT